MTRASARRITIGVDTAHDTPDTPDRPTLYRLAAEADADPRTVARHLRGEVVRGRAGERIRAALERLGEDARR